MKIAVIGAGLMGQAAVYDLARTEDITAVGVFDVDRERAETVARKFGENKTTADSIDAGDEQAVARTLEGYDAAVSCVTYRYNPGLTRAAVTANCHLVDLGGNNDTVRTQMEMDEAAVNAGVIVVPDCGLAPGMVAVLVADGVSRLDATKSVKIRVGGLPQSPRPPLNYQMLFSAEGLINEYWEPCVILKDGEKKYVNPMTDIEVLEFDGVGELEAFYTSGGTSTLPDTYARKIDFLDYKTIRYPGHCNAFKPMLEIGLASRQEIDVNGKLVEPRAVLKAVLDKNLCFNEPDMTLMRTIVEGEKDGQPKTVTYEMIDRQDKRSGLTAMMRTTSFPATTVAWMAASGNIEKCGVKPQERVVNPKTFLSQLKKRGLNISIDES